MDIGDIVNQVNFVRLGSAVVVGGLAGLAEGHAAKRVSSRVSSQYLQTPGLVAATQGAIIPKQGKLNAVKAHVFEQGAKLGYSAGIGYMVLGAEFTPVELGAYIVAARVGSEAGRIAGHFGYRGVKSYSAADTTGKK